MSWLYGPKYKGGIVCHDSMVLSIKVGEYVMALWY